MQPIERQTVELYRSLWEDLGNFRTAEVVAQFLDNVGLDRFWFAGKRCLDVGCGSGFATWAMRSLGAECVAADLCVGALADMARTMAGAPWPNFPVACSTAALPFADGRFDFVYCSGVLHHTLDPERGFREVARVVGPRGTLFVGVYGRGGMYNAVLKIGRGLARVAPRSWTASLVGKLVGDRAVPHSFVPAKVSILDNLYVPIRRRFGEQAVRQWFADAGFSGKSVVRTQTTIFDHTTTMNRLLFGQGYIQLRGTKGD